MLFWNLYYNGNAEEGRISSIIIDGYNVIGISHKDLKKQRDELVDEIQEKNIQDMVNSGAVYTVFNCPFCMFTLGEAVAEKGLMPILVSDLCQAAIG